MFYRIRSEIKYWCAKTLTKYEFPDEPLKKDIAERNYCKNYPYLFFDDSISGAKEFEESIYKRNNDIRKLFSLCNLRNIFFYIAAFFSTLFMLCYLLMFFLLFLIFSDILFTSNITDLKTYYLTVVLCSILVFICHGITNLYLNLQYKFREFSYLEFFCILQTFYIYQDLSNWFDDEIRRDSKIKKSLKFRIEKLSKLIYLYGKFEQDRLGTFSSISQGMIWRSSWLNSPQDTTITDLRDYFRQITYCLVVGKNGNIPIDNPSVFKQNKNNIEDWQRIINNADKSISLGAKLLNLIKLAKSFFM